MNVNDKFKVDGLIYKIVSSIDLEGGDLNLPSDCTLDFQGGSISNGTITLRNTKVRPNGLVLSDYISANITGTFAPGQCVFDPILGKPKWYNGSKWVDATGAEV